ncbi:MAG TPA: class I SAM-dependent methyltransferase [bacterium]|nr:class I SAM-dependent methyltransferase [bacterium]HPN42572.1 class I SAM-dependent methyltransferase [bacterium]
MFHTREKILAAPYTYLSYLYDFVMNHVNYKSWARYVAQIINTHGQNIHSIADISCGTGNFCKELLSLGYTVWGCDSCYNMVKMGKQKYDQEYNFYIWCADMQHLSFHKAPDMIVSLYDSMNYFLEPEQWSRCLQNVYSTLKSGGLFVFDVSTLHNSLDVFRNYSQREKSADGSYYRKSHFDKKSALQINYFEIKLNNYPGITFCETHRQRIHPLGEIMEFIQQTQFKILGCYNGFTFTPGDEYAERVHFVLAK